MGDASPMLMFFGIGEEFSPWFGVIGVLCVGVGVWLIEWVVFIFLLWLVFGGVFWVVVFSDEVGVSSWVCGNCIGGFFGLIVLLWFGWMFDLSGGYSWFVFVMVVFALFVMMFFVVLSLVFFENGGKLFGWSSGVFFLWFVFRFTVCHSLLTLLLFVVVIGLWSVFLFVVGCGWSDVGWFDVGWFGVDCVGVDWMCWLGLDRFVVIVFWLMVLGGMVG